MNLKIIYMEFRVNGADQPKLDLGFFVHIMDGCFANRSSMISRLSSMVSWGDYDIQFSDEDLAEHYEGPELDFVQDTRRVLMSKEGGDPQQMMMRLDELLEEGITIFDEDVKKKKITVTIEVK